MVDSKSKPDFEQRAYETGVKQHDFIRDLIAENFKVTTAAAATALRVLLTVNAGGAIALLGFIGAIAGKTKPVFENAGVFTYPMTLFGLGTILAVIATCGMYFAQGAFSYALSSQKFTVQHPFTEGTEKSKGWRIAGLVFQIVSISSAIASLLLFVFGLDACRTLVSIAKL